jgi:hypothetical protein
MYEDVGRFFEALPLDCAIPPGGLTGEIPNVWDGQDVVVLWENLGVEDSRVAADGSRNAYLRKLGTWEPVQVFEKRFEARWALRLTITRDFTLEVAAVAPDGSQVVPFRLRSDGGF